MSEAHISKLMIRLYGSASIRLYNWINPVVEIIISPYAVGIIRVLFTQLLANSQLCHWSSAQGGFESCDQVLLLNVALPLLDNTSICIQKEEMRLHAVAQLVFEALGRRVVDIQVDEIDARAVARLQPVHHRRHGFTGAIPKRKELHQLHFSRSKLHRRRIGGVQLGADIARRARRGRVRRGGGRQGHGSGLRRGRLVACGRGG